MNKRQAGGGRSIIFEASPRPIERTETANSQATPPIAGARVRMSELGAARCPRFAERKGVVIGGSRYNSGIRVLFDGYKSRVSLHRDYVEQIPSGVNVIDAAHCRADITM